ncbi:hypothetical protein AOLI_G00205990, partial [Acnodon oligacanthus]
FPEPLALFRLPFFVLCCVTWLSLYSLQPRQNVWDPSRTRANSHSSGSAGIKHHPAIKSFFKAGKSPPGVSGDGTRSCCVFPGNSGSIWMGPGQPGELQEEGIILLPWPKKRSLHPLSLGTNVLSLTHL